MTGTKQVASVELKEKEKEYNMLEQNADILIITDSIITRALGPYRIATEVRDNGYTCQVIDHVSFFTDDEILKIFETVIGPNTKILGIGSTYIVQPSEYLARHYISGQGKYSLGTVTKYIDIARKINPNIKVVLGGANSMWLSTPEVDTFILGYADRAIVEYLKYIDNKNPFFQFTVHTSGQIIVDGNKYNSSFEFNQSQIKYHPTDNVQQGETMSIEIARGCIFRCKFCAFPLNGKTNNEYIKSPNVLKEEFLRNYHEYGITKYIYVDDTHNDNVVKLRQLADIVQSLPFKLEHSCYIRLDLLRGKPEQYQLLKDGGIKSCFFGIESLNKESASIIGKELSPDRVIEELYNFRDRLPSVGTRAGFISGLPKETKESIQQWTETISQEDFPLDGFDMYSLSINRHPNKVFVSEFEIDSRKYYTWNNDIWHNGSFDKTWSDNYVETVSRNTTRSGRQRVAGFTPVILEHLGYTDVVKKPRRDFLKTVDQYHIASVDTYKHSLIKN